MIAPTTTLTPHGAADAGFAGDYWQLNTEGELVRAQRNIDTERSDRCGTGNDKLPETLQRQLAAKSQLKSAQQKVRPQVAQRNPRAKLRGKQTPTTQEPAVSHTTPHGLALQNYIVEGITGAEKSHNYWKRVHVEPRAPFCTAEQTRDAPDINASCRRDRQKCNQLERKMTPDEWANRQALGRLGKL